MFCLNIFYLVEICLITFLILLFEKFMNFSLFFQSFTSAKVMVYVNNKIFNIYSKFIVSLFPYCLPYLNVLNDKGNKQQKSFGHLPHLLFSEGDCYVVQSLNFYYQKNMFHNYPSLMKMFLCTHHIFAVLLSHC